MLPNRPLQNIVNLIINCEILLVFVSMIRQAAGSAHKSGRCFFEKINLLVFMSGEHPQDVRFSI